MPSLLGSTLGPYQILEQIGLGGMATVYKAYQPGMNRLVALKILPEHYARDPRFTKRFEREAQVVAKLEHRNIIPVYGYGTHNNITYLAMRYLQAGTVKDILAHGALPFADVGKLLSDIASALDYAHSHGVIHRDIKPSNILVDKQGNAYLTDFGIAKVLESTQEFTGSGVLGTPAYMAPEQVTGKQVTPQSDIYSLGVMLYEMVVGKPPFEADTPMAIALMHVHEPLPLPQIVRPDLPESVALVILKALAKDPDERYRSAGELAAAYTAAVGVESVGQPSQLITIATQAVSGKGSEEITYDVREEIKRRETSERTKRLKQFAPYTIGAILIIALIGVLWGLGTQVNAMQENSQKTATTVALAVQIAAATARAPTLTPLPTSTIDIFFAATRQAELTATAYQPTAQYVSTENARMTLTRAAMTNTPTVTPTPTNTPLPFYTLTPTTAPIPTGNCPSTHALVTVIILWNDKPIPAGVIKGAITDMGHITEVINLSSEPDANGRFVVCLHPNNSLRGFRLPSAFNSPGNYACYTTTNTCIWPVLAPGQSYQVIANMLRTRGDGVRIIGPQGGIDVSPTNIVLSWESYPDAVKYEVTWREVEPWIPFTITTTSTTFAVPNATPGKCYGWGIIAYNANGTAIAQGSPTFLPNARLYNHPNASFCVTP